MACNFEVGRCNTSRSVEPDADVAACKHMPSYPGSYIAEHDGLRHMMLLMPLSGENELQ